MNFKIKQLNFLYLYYHCKDIHLDVTSYDDIDIEDIETEDINNLLMHLLVSENISISYDSFLFQGNIEDLLGMSNTERLSKLGANMIKNLQYLDDFKKNVDVLQHHMDERNFIDKFSELIGSFRDVKSNMKIIESYKTVVVKKKDKKNVNKKIGSMLFS